MQLNNPVGGLGLTTGILDAAHLAQALQKVLLNNASEDVLEEYANVRRDTFKKLTDTLSTANLLRLRSSDPADVAERDRFFGVLGDPTNGKGRFEIISKEIGLSTTLDPKELGRHRSYRMVATSILAKDLMHMNRHSDCDCTIELRAGTKNLFAKRNEYVVL